MHLRHPEPAEPWHSPDRAWVPLMWLIRAVVVCLGLALFAPLMELAMATI